MIKGESLMEESLRIKIDTKDRVGMVLDVLKVLSENNINIISMEVSPGVIFLKLDNLPEQKWLKLKEEVQKTKGVENITEIELLPYERRERQIKAVLDSVSEGIIAVDKNGHITIFNPVAEKILQLKEEEVLGKPLKEVLPIDAPMLKTLKTGRGYDNEEIMIDGPKGRSHYITTGRPIKNEYGRTIGAVASLKDMSKVRELVYSITKPSMITFDDIIGESPAIKRVKNLAKTVARSDSTVLLIGESGTGKELFARAIHMASPRSNNPFVPVNCAALPDTLLESELFGYEEGAFTGARKGGKQGLFEFAQRGTIFLDEIGELVPHLQVKLLRVLQEGRVRRIGGNQEIKIDVRVIAATNKDLEEKIRKGEFREDLYYRLNVIPIYIPPLRERKEDIPILLDYFIEKFKAKMNIIEDIKVDGEAMKKLMSYSWPGNIRELANIVERGINLAGSNIIKPENLLVNTDDEKIYDNCNDNPPYQEEIIPLKEATSRAEKEVIEKALKKYKSSREAGRVLGVSHTTILNKMKRYNIKL
jgi:transcriptional regulator of aroF, aroG, tyrA and aromatic amino acid transport